MLKDLPRSFVLFNPSIHTPSEPHLRPRPRPPRRPPPSYLSVVGAFFLWRRL